MQLHKSKIVQKDSTQKLRTYFFNLHIQTILDCIGHDVEGMTIT